MTPIIRKHLAMLGCHLKLPKPQDRTLYDSLGLLLKHTNALQSTLLALHLPFSIGYKIVFFFFFLEKNMFKIFQFIATVLNCMPGDQEYYDIMIIIIL